MLLLTKLRNTKMNFKNIGAIIMGKPLVNKRSESDKMNFIKKHTFNAVYLEKMLQKLQRDSSSG